MGLNNGGSFGGEIVADVEIGDVNVLEAITDDSAFTPATSKVFPTGATFDDVAPDSVDEGDIGALRMSANRDLYATLRDAQGNERGVNIDASNRLTVVDGPGNTLLGTIDTDTGAMKLALGATDDAVPAAGGVGSVPAQLRRVTTDLGTIDTDTTAMALALGATDDTLSDAGGVGSVPAQLRRLTTDLAAVEATLTNLEKCLMGFAAPNVDSPGMQSAVVILSAATADQVLIASDVNKQIWVFGLHMMADTDAGTVVLHDESAAALTGAEAVSDEGGWVLPMSNNFAMPYFKLGTDKDLEATTAGLCTIGGSIHYAIISV